VQNHGRRHLFFQSFFLSYNAFDGPIRNKMAAHCLLYISRPLEMKAVLYRHYSTVIYLRDLHICRNVSNEVSILKCDDKINFLFRGRAAHPRDLKPWNLTR